MTANTAPVCVLTGIVRSGALGRAARRRDGRDRGVRRRRHWPRAPEVREERFRGDGWQLYLGAPRWTLRAALGLRAAIRSRHPSVETRLAAAFGPARLGRGWPPPRARPSRRRGGRSRAWHASAVALRRRARVRRPGQPGGRPVRGLRPLFAGLDRTPGRGVRPAGGARCTGDDRRGGGAGGRAADGARAFRAGRRTRVARCRGR